MQQPPGIRPLATHFEDFLGEPLSGSSQLDEVERQLRAQLAELNELHRQRVAPIIAALVRYYSLRPTPQVMVTLRAGETLTMSGVLHQDPSGVERFERDG